jgi:hypothetical protein
MDSVILQHRSDEDHVDEVEHLLGERGVDGYGTMLREKPSLGLECRDKPLIVGRQAESLGGGGRRRWRGNRRR